MANSKFGTISAGDTVVVALDGTFHEIEVINRTGSGEMFVEIDSADDSEIVPDTAGLEFLPAAISFIKVPINIGGTVNIKIYSATEQKYAVRGD